VLAQEGCYRERVQGELSKISEFLSIYDILTDIRIAFTCNTVTTNSAWPTGYYINSKGSVRLLVQKISDPLCFSFSVATEDVRYSGMSPDVRTAVKTLSSAIMLTNSMLGYRVLPTYRPPLVTPSDSDDEEESTAEIDQLSENTSDEDLPPPYDQLEMTDDEEDSVSLIDHLPDDPPSPEDLYESEDEEQVVP